MLHLSWRNTYKSNYSLFLVFPTWNFLLPGLSCWLYLKVPSGLSTISSLAMVRFPAMSSVTFALVLTSMWKENVLKHFYMTHTHFRDAVLSCYFLLKLHVGLPKSFQTFNTVFALSSPIILQDLDEKQLQKIWDSTHILYAFQHFFPITCFFNVSHPHIVAIWRMPSLLDHY